MVTSIMKAKSVGTAANPGGTSVGSGGGIYKIKVVQYYLNSRVPLEDVTGDGDAGLATCEGLPADRVTLRGFCVSGGAIGLANLGNIGAVPIDLLLDSQRKLSGSIMASEININWQRPRGSIPMALAGTIQNRMVEGTVS